jgi:hypothetical protein
VTTREAIASQALARLGEPAISSFTEDSDSAERVAALYEPTVLQILGSHNWRFASKRAELQEDATDNHGVAKTAWQRAFLMPDLGTDRVGQPLEVFSGTGANTRPARYYEVEDRWIFTNETALTIEYTWRVPELRWPGYFTTLVVEALAAVLALPITENASKEEHHRIVAYGPAGELGRGGLFRTATQADARGLPPRSVIDDGDDLGSIRFGGA